MRSRVKKKRERERERKGGKEKGNEWVRGWRGNERWGEGAD